MGFCRFWRKLSWALSRRKPMDISEEAPTDLDRCLGTLDLTAMGVGATLGFGLYVLAGEVAASKAGPGVVLSFVIAAIASTFSALCYAEFAAKVPKSGSAYAYSYITVGEFVAFVIGWNLTLEHVIGTASLARGYSDYLSFLFGFEKANHTMSATWLPESMNSLISEFDQWAFMLTILVTGLLLLGVQVSSKFQVIFASLNLAVACFIFVCGLGKINLHNWALEPSELPSGAGSGGFLPFGWTGVVAGAGTCFFAFVGFDGIAATAEEVKNPRKAIPNSILWTSGIIFVIYCCMSTIQTLIWPYWDQHQKAPLPYIFGKLGMPAAEQVVLWGVLAGLSTSFVGSFLPLPRILYAMARDAVIYRFLSKVSKRFKVPYVATLVGGVLIAFLASLLEIKQLADMLSIGTLAAYSLVSISVLLLRYEYKRPTECENPLPLTLDEVDKPIATVGQQLAENRALALASNGTMGLVGGSEKQLKREASPSGRSTPSQQCGSSVSSSPSSDSCEPDSSSCSLGASSSSTTRSLVSLFWDGTRGPGNTVRRPDEQTTHISRCLILLLVLVTTLLDMVLKFWADELAELEPLACLLATSLLAATLVLSFLLNRLPVQEPSRNSFEVPLVPALPLFSVLINTYLMVNLSYMTWIRFAVWMALGFFIYFTYGIFKSTGYKDSSCH